MVTFTLSSLKVTLASSIRILFDSLRATGPVYKAENLTRTPILQSKQIQNLTQTNINTIAVSIHNSTTTNSEARYLKKVILNAEHRPGVDVIQPLFRFSTITGGCK